MFPFARANNFPQANARPNNSNNNNKNKVYKWFKYILILIILISLILYKFDIVMIVEFINNFKIQWFIIFNLIVISGVIFYYFLFLILIYLFSNNHLKLSEQFSVSEHYFPARSFLTKWLIELNSMSKSGNKDFYIKDIKVLIFTYILVFLAALYLLYFYS